MIWYRFEIDKEMTKKRGIKLAGNKIWLYANRSNLEIWHVTWF